MNVWDVFINALNVWQKNPRITVSMDIEKTGYESVKNLPKLITAILSVYENPDYRPVVEASTVIQTFCNKAVQAVANAMGCNDLDLLTADQMFQHFTEGKVWKEVLMRDAQFLANQGTLVIAALPSKILGGAHGHVCVVRPGEQVWSEHWKSMVPAVMNIGAHNFILRFTTGQGLAIDAGVNGAFQMIPHFFAWEPSL